MAQVEHTEITKPFDIQTKDGEYLRVSAVLSKSDSATSVGLNIRYFFKGKDGRYYPDKKRGVRFPNSVSGAVIDALKKTHELVPVA